MKINLLLCFGLTAFFISCSSPYTYFTQGLYEQQRWDEDDLMRIQFYLSDNIVLSRTLGEEETTISEGKIKVKNGKRVEQVVINSGTPGVLVLMPKEDRFAISFEDKDNEAYLMFGPNPKYEDRYALLAKDWDREYGQVHYKGIVYYVDAESAFACLMVDLSKEGQDQYHTRKLEGRTIKSH